MLPASITQSGTSVETVVSDDTGLGCLEVLGHDPSVLGSSHIPHTISDPVCFLLSDVSHRIFRAEMTWKERGFSSRTARRSDFVLILSLSS